MPSNPITPEEQYDILINRSLTPRDGVTTETYMAAGYITMPPATVDGPVKWRLFDAAYIKTGIVDPNRLGTGATGAGNLYLADDGTWKVISGAPGVGDMLKATYDVDNDGTVDSAERIEIIVRNSTGTTLTKGTVVYLSGATGNRPNALRSQANSEATSSKTIGIVVADITNNSDGYVAVNGTLHDLDTSAYADGAALWLSPTVAGGYTTTVPSEPNHSVFIGYVARSHPTQGRLVILIQNGYELNELHDVYAPSPTNGDLLQWDSANAYWKNVPVATVVPTPTLAQVTTAGNTTTNAITVGGVKSTADYELRADNAAANTRLGRFKFIRSIYDPTGVGASIDFWRGPSAAEGIIAFSTNPGTAGDNAAERMRITTGGNILIGTTTDSGYKLDVAGNTRVFGGNTSADIPFIINSRFQFKGDGVLLYGNAAGHGRLTWDNSGAYFTGLSGYGVGLGANGVLNHLFINTSGNVGIGTTSPNSRLEVAGLSILTNSAGNNYNENIRLPESSAGWSSIVMGGAIATGGTGATVWSILKNPSASGHRFSIMNNTSEYFTIFTSGNVSIGSTTDNGNKLNVAGTTRLGGNTLVSGPTEDASNTATLTVTTANTSLRLGGNTTYSWIQSHSAKPLYINELGNNLILNLLGGSVGIGTASPGYKLDVNGAVRVQSIAAGTANYNRFLVSDSGVVKYRVASEMLSDIDVPGYVSSRGENLVTNGTGLRKSNYNFSAFTFVGNEAYYSTGSFQDTSFNSTRFNDEAIPVDVNQRYRLSVSARQNPYVGARYYVGISLIDADGFGVNAVNHMYKANTLTTLAAQLNPGDTTVYLTSAANWENGGTAGVNTHLRSFIFWNYVNSFGYAFPPLTYSRNWYGNMWNPGGVNTTTNTITLITPWAGPVIAAGTQLSNGSSGGTYKYITANNAQIPNAWTNYTGIIEGVDTTGTNVTDKFAPGTAAIKILFLNNRDVAGATVYYTNVQFGLDLINPNTHILNGTSLQTANFNISGNGYIGGNVGIGTTTPNAKLDVNGTFNLLGGVGGYWLKGFQGNSTVNGNSPFLALVNNNTIASATFGWLFYDSDADGSFNLYRRSNSTTGNQVFTISRSTGNFLINTSTDAGFKLDVVGSERLQVNSLTTTVASGGLTLANTTSATSGVTQQNSPSIIFSGSAWVSGALKTHDIAIQSEPQTWDSTRMIWYKRLNSGSWLPFFGLRSDSTGQNSLFLYPVGYLKDGVGETHSAGFTISNGSQATAVLQQYSPAFMVQGYGWNGTSSVLTSSSWLFAPEAGTSTFQGVSKFIYNESLNNELLRYEFGERLGMWVNKLSLANYVTTINSRTTITGSVTAASTIARGTYLNQTLVATANNDVLVALDIQPTFTTGSFTGTRVYGIRSSYGFEAPIYTAAANLRLTSGTSTQPINFYLNLTSQEIGRFHGTTGNLTLQNGGTFTDAGYRLDVNGTARVQGSITATLASTSTANVVYYNSSTGLLTYGAVPTPTTFQIDYDYNIVGLKNGSNVVFTSSANFVLTTTRVYLNGVRLTRGVGYDYVETGTNQITLASAPNPTDQLIIEYQL